MARGKFGGVSVRCACWKDIQRLVHKGCSAPKIAQHRLIGSHIDEKEDSKDLNLEHRIGATCLSDQSRISGAFRFVVWSFHCYGKRQCAGLLPDERSDVIILSTCRYFWPKILCDKVETNFIDGRKKA